MAINQINIPTPTIIPKPKIITLITYSVPRVDREATLVYVSKTIV